MGLHVLLVCVGNVCRSPAAELLLRAAVPDPVFTVASAGLAAPQGRPIHPVMARLLAARGLDASAHRARQLLPAQVRRADLVLVMEAWHRERLLAGSPEARGRVHLLAPGGIADPIDTPDEAFPPVFEQLAEAVERWQERLTRLA